MARPKKDAGEDKAKLSALDVALASIETNFGKGMVFDLQKVTLPKIPKISYGSIRIDKAAGGGFAKGRIVEIYGPESSGKTTLACTMICEAQRDFDFVEEGRRALFIDAENALDLNYACGGLGVDRVNMILSQPDTMEQAFEIAELLIETGKISICVFDSVSAMVPKAELEGKTGDSFVGLHARLMSQGLRKLTATAAKMKTPVVFINQIRMKIGVMWGSPEVTSGGQALKFFASQRIDIRRQMGDGSGVVKDGDGTIISTPTTVKFVKNKLAPPFSTAQVQVEQNVGINRVAELLDIVGELGLTQPVRKAGGWYHFDTNEAGEGKEKIQGRENAITAFAEPRFALMRVELAQKIKSVYFPVLDFEPEEEDEEEEPHGDD